VEVQRDDRDTHTNSFPEVRQLYEAIDQTRATLLAILKSSSLLDETVVLWMGVFGRTPRINAQRGRDHLPRVTPAIIRGGGFAAGATIGKTNRTGTQIDGDGYNGAGLFRHDLYGIEHQPDPRFHHVLRQSDSSDRQWVRDYGTGVSSGRRTKNVPGLLWGRLTFSVFRSCLVVCHHLSIVTAQRYLRPDHGAAVCIGPIIFSGPRPPAITPSGG